MHPADISRSSCCSFLRSSGPGRLLSLAKPKQIVFAQGDKSDCVLYLQEGRVRLTVVSADGKEATLTLLSAGDFFGEESLLSVGAKRLTTATAIEPTVLLKIPRSEMFREVREDAALREQFMSYLLARGIRAQADLLDQLFNSSEKRLARTLLLLADFDPISGFAKPLPRITQESLAEMIGTTRSRVSYFMNRFRRLGLIEYDGRIRVHKSLAKILTSEEPDAFERDLPQLRVPEAASEYARPECR